MFIRDLEYYQLETSNQQLDRVNGGGKKPAPGPAPGPVKPAPQPRTPSVAIAQFSVTSVAQGVSLATTFGSQKILTLANNGSAVTALESEIFSIAVN